MEKKWYAYMQVDPHMDRKTALLEGRRPHLFKTFLFIKIKDWNLVCILFIQNEIQWYAYVWVNPPRATKRPLRGAEGPTFLFIKIESWNFICIYGEKWYAYMWVDSHMSRKTALLGGRRPPFFKTFLFIKIEDWNLVCILLIRNEIQWYAYV